MSKAVYTAQKGVGIYDLSLHNIHWFPSHMKRGIDDIRKQMSRCDLVIEVRDARLPVSTFNPILSQLISPKKKRLIVYNKADLIGSDCFNDKTTDNYYLKIIKNHQSQQEQQQHQQIIPLSTKNSHSYKNLLTLIKKSLYDTENPPHHYRYSPLPGDADTTKENKRFRLLVVGFPNLGKSTLINRLRSLGTDRNPSSVQTGDRPGITRAMGGLIKIIEEPQVFIYDTPGILMPTLSNRLDPLQSHKLALIGCLHEAQYDGRIVVDYLFTILKSRNFKEVETFDNSQEWIISYVQMKGLRKGDVNNAVKIILSSYRKGNFGKWCLEDY